MEFKGTKGKWVIGRIDEPTPYNDMTGYHTIITEGNGEHDGMIDVWFSNSHIVKTKHEALANALLISKAPEMLEKLIEISKTAEKIWEIEQDNPFFDEIDFAELDDLIKEATELNASPSDAGNLNL